MTPPTKWLVVVAGIALSAALTVQADVPRTIHYQGRLTDHDGTPLVGEHTLTLRLYDAAEAGTRLWEEAHPVAFERDDRGIFSLLLGSVTPFPATLQFNQPVWLTTEVDSQGELLPRQLLSSVSSALNADRLDGLDTADLLKALSGQAPVAVTTTEITDGSLTAADTAENFLTAGSGVLITKTPASWAIAAVGSGGDITSVTAGAGLTGGATRGEAALALAVPVSVAHGGTGIAALPKGHLLAGNGSAAATALAPGGDQTLLMADASQPAGLRWTTPCWPIGGSDATSRSGTFQLAGFGGSDTSGRSDRLWPAPAGGALTGLRATVGQAPGVNGSWTVRFKKNGAAALSCTISGTSTACAASGTETVAAGDRIGVEFMQVGNAAGTQGAAWSACLTTF